MRGLRSTLMLVVVLLGLGGYIYFGNPGGEEGGSKLEKVFASVEAGKIEEVKVTQESGVTTTVKKAAEGWQITEPITAAAADPELSSLTNAVSQLEVVRVIDENPTDLKNYGLDPPRIQVEFKSTGGQPAGRLLVGQKTPTGATLYARREDQTRVFLIQAFQESSLNKSTFDLRDKSIVKVDRDKVDGVEVTTDGRKFELAKQGSDWQIAQPLKARADFSAAEGLIGRVESAQMTSIVTESAEPAELKKFGLEAPPISVSLRLGSARATLALGGKSPDGNIYARDTSKPAVFTVAATMADDFRKDLFDYRRKDVFEFRAFNATKVEFTRGNQVLTFERVKGQGDNAQDTWRRITPSAADADRAKVESLLAGLADMRATAFTDITPKTGLNAPALTVRASFDEGKKEERVSFGRGGDDVFASRPGDPDAARIDAEKLTETLAALDELAK